MLNLHGEPIKNRAIIGMEERDAGRGGDAWQTDSGNVFVAPILMHTLLVLVSNTETPVAIKNMLQAGTRRERGVLAQISTRSDKQTKGGVVAQTRIESGSSRHAPGVFSVETQSAHALRKSAVRPAARRGSGTNRRGIGNFLTSASREYRDVGVSNIKTRILRINGQRFGVTGARG